MGDQQNEVDLTAKKAEAAGHQSGHGARDAYQVLLNDFDKHSKTLAKQPGGMNSYVDAVTARVKHDDPKLAVQLPHVWLHEHATDKVDANHKLKKDGSDVSRVLNPQNKQWSEFDRHMAHDFLDQRHHPTKQSRPQETRHHGDKLAGAQGEHKDGEKPAGTKDPRHGAEKAPGQPDKPRQALPGSPENVGPLTGHVAQGKDGQYLYDLATKTLGERAALTGEAVNSDAVMHEVNRIMVNNGYQDANLGDKTGITMKDLPKSWNEIKSGQQFNVYNDQERAQLVDLMNRRAAEQRNPKGRDHYVDDGAPEGAPRPAAPRGRDHYVDDGAPEGTPRRQAPIAVPPREVIPQVAPQAPATPAVPPREMSPPIVPREPRTPPPESVPRKDYYPPAAAPQERVPQPERVPPQEQIRFPSAKAAEIPRILDNMNISQDHQQMVVVVGDGTNNPNGTMQLYRRVGEHWQPTNESWRVTVGENGMAWGDGLIQNADAFGRKKHERDGRAPSGLFSLGTAFGKYSPGQVDTQMPYRQAFSNDYFVDDPNSPSYNQWKRLNPGDDPRRYFNHAEHMRINGPQYDLGVVVNHNMNPVVPGDGSAIFMHVWSRPGVGTAGCTAMAAPNMRRLMSWLDPNKCPLLLQVPNDSIDALKRAQLR